MYQSRILLCGLFLSTTRAQQQSIIVKQTPNQQPIEWSDEQRLFNYLFDPQRGYDIRIAPPSKNKEGSLQLEIEIQLELLGIMKVDKDSSTVKFKAAFRQWWYDPRLTWNTSDFGGVDRLWLETIDGRQTWLPDTIIREDAGSTYFSDFKYNQLRAHNTGLQYWTRLGELSVVASLDFTKYPFDNQEVNITIGSWLYFDKRITYLLRSSNQGLVIQDKNNWYLNNIEWNFKKSDTTQIVLVQTQGTYKYWRFRIILQRDGGTMLVGLIIPGILVAFLGSLYYLLPLGTGERISYLATILLTEIMFLIMVTQIVPQSKYVPAIAFLFLQQTILMSIVTIFVLILENQQRVLNSQISQYCQQSSKNADEEIFSILPKNQVHNEFSIQHEDQSQKQFIKLDSKVIDGRESLVKRLKRLKQIDLIVFVINIIIFFTLTIEKILAIEIVSGQ